MEVARTSILLAAQAGPTSSCSVPATRCPSGCGPSDTSHGGVRGRSVDAAHRPGGRRRDHRGRPVGVRPCRARDGELPGGGRRARRGPDWVIGRSRLRHGPLRARRPRGTRLHDCAPGRRRRRSSCGSPRRRSCAPTCLRAHPLDGRRPWGAWLRARERRGSRRAGSCRSRCRCGAAPVGATAYWPDVMARQRGAAADLADATWSGTAACPVGRRPAERRELYAWAMLGWVPLLFVTRRLRVASRSSTGPVGRSSSLLSVAAVALVVAAGRTRRPRARSSPTCSPRCTRCRVPSPHCPAPCAVGCDRHACGSRPDRSCGPRSS